MCTTRRPSKGASLLVLKRPLYWPGQLHAISILLLITEQTYIALVIAIVISFSPSSFYCYIQLLLQSYELVKKISKTNGVPAKEFVWALQADVECCEKIKKMFR